MSRKEKLIRRFLLKPKDFSFKELETLLAYYGYYPDNGGKTNGSAVRFVNMFGYQTIMLHKPHDHKYLLDYQINSIIATMKEDGLL